MASGASTRHRVSRRTRWLPSTDGHPSGMPVRFPKCAIVFYDRDVVVVDKPVGILSVADEPGNKETTVDCTRTLLRRMDREGVDAPLGVVHRLDKDTSGPDRVCAYSRREARAGSTVPRAHHRSRLPCHRARGCRRDACRDVSSPGSWRRNARLLWTLPTCAGRRSERGETLGYAHQPDRRPCGCHVGRMPARNRAPTSDSNPPIRTRPSIGWRTRIHPRLRRPEDRSNASDASMRAHWDSCIPGPPNVSCSSANRPMTFGRRSNRCGSDQARACAHYVRKCERVARGANHGARRRQDRASWLGEQRRVAPPGRPFLRVAAEMAMRFVAKPRRAPGPPAFCAPLMAISTVQRTCGHSVNRPMATAVTCGPTMATIAAWAHNFSMCKIPAAMQSDAGDPVGHLPRRRARQRRPRARAAVAAAALCAASVAADAEWLLDADAGVIFDSNLTGAASGPDTRSDWAMAIGASAGQFFAPSGSDGLTLAGQCAWRVLRSLPRTQSGVDRRVGALSAQVRARVRCAVGVARGQRSVRRLSRRRPLWRPLRRARRIGKALHRIDRRPRRSRLRPALRPARRGRRAGASRARSSASPAGVPTSRSITR